MILLGRCSQQGQHPFIVRNEMSRFELRHQPVYSLRLGPAVADLDDKAMLPAFDPDDLGVLDALDLALVVSAEPILWLDHARKNLKPC